MRSERYPEHLSRLAIQVPTSRSSPTLLVRCSGPILFLRCSDLSATATGSDSLFAVRCV